jgi:3-hydroxyisobutyrate dehydrogenase-like beta-hydroxyacid dehydrogenase
MVPHSPPRTYDYLNRIVNNPRNAQMNETVAILGLGEAGTHYASDLLTSGLQVTAYDPAQQHLDPVRHPDPEDLGWARQPEVAGVRYAGRAVEAVAEAAIVFSLNSGRVAVQVAADAASGLREGVVFADFNTAAPEVKRRVAEIVEDAGALFADVAVLAPVPRRGLRTPLAVSGSGRERLATFLAPFGVPVEDAGPKPGAAAERKLLRSVFMKGLAAVIMESLEIAAASGQQEWLRAQIAEELTTADATLLDRLITGTHQHAHRRLDEMHAASALATDLATPSFIIPATIARLERLLNGPQVDG